VLFDNLIFSQRFQSVSVYSTLQLESESVTGLYNKVITRDYEVTGMVGRNIGLHIGTEYDVDYGYDGYGRFNSLENGDDTFTYGYLANSNLISTLTGPNGISTTNTYETNRNLITSIENKYSSTSISKYDYANDAIGRRTSMAKSGTAFAQSDNIAYGYNDRSEITSAVAANDMTYNFGFSFDNIGNRITGTESGVLRNYTSNLLNQYTQIDNPSQSPTYDDDGDMLTNGNWTYTWNAENRLSVAESSTQKLEFAYDYMGRRVEKKIYDKTGSVWTLTKHLRFVYDDYKLIEELDVLNSNAILKKFIWNGDTPFSIHDTTAYTTYYYTLDVNKNISELLDASGSVVAHYEYAPFGKLIKSSGYYAEANYFRFSSEYYDEETGLVYYNFRYYNPSLGRWTKRDDIEERGGLNLYAMLRNDTVSLSDYLGWAPPIAPEWGQWRLKSVIVDDSMSADMVKVVYVMTANWEIKLNYKCKECIKGKEKLVSHTKNFFESKNIDGGPWFINDPTAWPLQPITNPGGLLNAIVGAIAEKVATGVFNDLKPDMQRKALATKPKKNPEIPSDLCPDK